MRLAAVVVLCVAAVSCGSPDGKHPTGRGLRDIDWFQYSSTGRIAAIATVDGEPYTLEVGNKPTTTTAVLSGQWVLSASWLPDRDELVVATTERKRPDSPSKLEVMSADGKRRRRVVPSVPLIIDGGIAMTSDELAIVAGRVHTTDVNDLWLVNLGGGEVERLTATGSEDEGSPVTLSGARVAYVRGRPLSETTAANGSIVILSLRTHASRSLRTDGLVVADLGRGPASDMLTFSAFPDNDRSRLAIWLVDPATSSLRRCPAPGSSPAARPKSDQISFIEPRYFSVDDVAAADCVRV